MKRDWPSPARLARGFFIAHVAVIVFATIALVTIIGGALPPALQSGFASTVYRLGWTFSGPTYVVLGALAALCHSAAAIGWRRSLALFAVASSIALASELLGTMTGVPFGPYGYTSLLGYRIAGHVPFPIPLSWYFMIYCALAICGRLLSTRRMIVWAVTAGAILTAWDVAMDPAMSLATQHWVWYTNGVYFGMPLTNWVGWLLTGSIIAYAMLRIVPPAEIVHKVSPSRLPIALYGINAVMPVALCARHGLWPAAIIGAVAMAVPVALALRQPIQRTGLRVVRSP